jgi:hypothetical protein
VQVSLHCAARIISRGRIGHSDTYKIASLNEPIVSFSSPKSCTSHVRMSDSVGFIQVVITFYFVYEHTRRGTCKFTDTQTHR